MYGDFYVMAIMMPAGSQEYQTTSCNDYGAAHDLNFQLT